MTLLPNGRSASYREDSERSAKRELHRITEAYLTRVRDIYPDIRPEDQEKLAAAMQALKTAVLPAWHR